MGDGGHDTKRYAVPKYMNEREAAEYLGLQAKTLQRWRWRGDGPIWHKIGGAVRYRQADLDAFAQPKGGAA